MAQSNQLLTDVLRDVSRSFYRTLQVLPKSIRSQIGLAYLLARTSDTIADTEIVSSEQRLKLLEELRERILGNSKAPVAFGELPKQQGSPAERLLLERSEETLAVLESFSTADKQRIREALDVIISGQELDLRRFAEASDKKVVALKNEAELDDYTYRVAGCVGEFWTEMCRAHVFSPGEIERARLHASSFDQDGLRFGKGLQLFNILRDLPADLRKGRCYLPADKLKEAGLAPADLLQPEKETQLRPVYDRYLDLCEAQLSDGWRYTNTIPPGQMRLRLACAWPILIGLKTILLLRTGRVLDPQQRLKISRNEVYGIMLKTLLYLPSPQAWQKLAGDYVAKR
jgi:farnesyl-diphosphate farnesyltransferase